MPRRLPTSATVTVTWRGVPREVLYRPDASIYRLLADAIREHGLKFATNPGLRLYGPDGKQLHNINAAKRCGVTPGAQLKLAAPDPHQDTR
jgi:hypothetical protein